MSKFTRPTLKQLMEDSDKLKLGNDDLEAFFTRLIHARPDLARRAYREIILNDDVCLFDRDERAHLAGCIVDARRDLLLNPLSQNGVGSTDENATS